MKKTSTGERLETFVYTRDTIEHLHRYGLVLEYVKNKTVLDIASGEGYGSHLMSEHAQFVYGVDISKDSIEYAQSKYKKSNLEFKCGSASKIPIEDNSVEIVISFETIEHHDEHEQMMNEIKRVLKPDGLIIISTPDKLFYSDKRNFKNKFHIKELYKQEFVDLITKYFSNIQVLSQVYLNNTSLIQPEGNNDKMVSYLGDYESIIKKNLDPLYLIILASDSKLVLQGSSLFDGSLIVKDSSVKIYETKSYKLGHLILSPIKYLKKNFF